MLADVRHLIDAARQRVASAVNAELTQLYWQIGRRISTELLQGQRAEYGKQAVAELARQLTAEFGKGWSEQQLRHCMRLAEIFADGQILSTVRRELSWSHLKTLIYIDAPSNVTSTSKFAASSAGACGNCKNASIPCFSSAPLSRKSLKKPSNKISSNPESKASSRPTSLFATLMCWTFLACPTAER
ncbi:MAG: DUF1016 N-terminal domain-containing protein [Oxalobacteraceae bacterium]|nr:DUF1016 N-terminal domain-containing protein [Oxalobacteraceae bacterium]